MIEFGLAFLIIGDWFFTNRENIMFAIDCTQNAIFKKGDLQDE